jgi:hypothetical protein
MLTSHDACTYIKTGLHLHTLHARETIYDHESVTTNVLGGSTRPARKGSYTSCQTNN